MMEGKALSIQSLFTDWLLSLSNSVSPHTYRMYKKRLSDLLKALEALGVREVEDLQKPSGRELLYHAVPKHSATVVEQTVAAWNNFRAFADEVKGIPLPSIPKRNLPKTKKREPKPLSKEELQRLLSYLKEKDKDLYLSALLMAYAGLRASEVLSLNKFSFEKVGDRLIVRVKGKGGKERVVPLPAGAGKEVEENLDAFPLLRWSSQRYLSLYRGLKRAGRKVGIEKLTPHRLRHTFGTELVNRGVSVRTVQALMGHSNLNTTAGYLGVASRELFEAVERLE